MVYGYPLKLRSFPGLRGRGSRAGLFGRQSSDDVNEGNDAADSSGADGTVSSSDGGDFTGSMSSGVTDFNITSTVRYFLDSMSCYFNDNFSHLVFPTS